jgi:Chaperone of endosialidase
MAFKVKDGLIVGTNTVIDGDGNIVVPGKLTTSNTTTTRASFNLGTASADPSAPSQGDFWYNGGAIKVQQSSATKTVAYLDSTITGNAANVTGTVAIANGGTGATTASGARTNIGATTVGSNIFTLANPSAITFVRVNADNTVTARTPLQMAADIGYTTNTASSLVARDASGNFSAGTITAALSGNSSTATTLQTARTIGISGGATGTATSFNGSANITIPVTDLNASNLSSGTVPTARLSGTYSGISIAFAAGQNAFSYVSSGSTDTNARTVSNLASYRSASATTTGAIVFTAPNTSSTIMHQFSVRGLLYNTSIVDFTVQGYRTTGAWNDTLKVLNGNTDVQVRWGVDPSGRNCLIIGDTTTVWSYPHFVITEALFSHTNANDAYTQGWTTSLVTDLSTYTNVTGSLTATEFASGVTAGTYGSSSAIPVITINSAGKITSAANTGITIGNGTLGVAIGAAGATNSTVTWGTASGFSANTSTNYTYDIRVGPALTALATTMTGATSGFIKKSAQDTYVLDTNTYLTSQNFDFSTVAIGTDSGYTWGTANTNTNQVAETVGDTLTLVRGLTGSTAGIDLFTSTVAGTDAIKIAHADTSSLSGTQGSAGIASITVDEMGHITGVSTATYLTGNQSITLSGDTTGSGTTAITTTTNYMTSSDDRVKAPSDDSTTKLRFGFTSWNNNNTTPYADYLHMRSYTDASGGNDNLVMFRKDAIGMRIWQQTYGSATAYSSYKDVAFTSDIGNGSFGVSIGTAGATNTTVTWGTSTGFSANTGTNYTYDLKVGPALTALSSSMTGATVGFLRKTAQDTYTLDTNANFSAVAVTDTTTGYTWAATGTASADVFGDTLTLVSGSGINIDVDATNDAIKIEHSDTSTQANVSYSGNVFVQGLSFDTYGHVTAVSSGTASFTDTNTTYSIKASSVTGGANLDLDAGGSGSGTDSVKFAGGGSTTVSYTDVNTITISSSSPSQATSTVLGTVKLGSDTAQTVAANAVSSTASRSYAVQLNASGQMLVNVPWTDTDTDTNTYPTTWTWSAGTTSGPTASITGTSSTISVAAVPAAGSGASGIVTTGAQTFAGTKTFSSTISGSIDGNSATSNKITITSGTVGVDYDIDGSGTVTLTDGTEYGKVIGGGVAPAAVSSILSTSGYTSGTGRFALKLVEGNQEDALRIVSSLAVANYGDTFTLGNSDSTGIFKSGLAVSGRSIYLKSNGSSVLSADSTGFFFYGVSTQADGLRRAGDLDGSDDYSYRVRNVWDGTYWRLRGYSGSTTFHAEVRVGYADTAPWTGISGRPTAVSSFTNDSGYITSSGSISGNAGTVTNGVYTIGNQTIAGVKTYSNTLRVFNTSGLIQTIAPSLASAYTLTHSLDETSAYWDLNSSIRGYKWYNNSSATLLADLTSTGSFTASGSVTAYSDARLKTDLQVIPDALNKINQLTGYTYTRKDTGERQTGIIAQDLEKVLPEAVLNSGEYKSVAYGNIVGLLIEAIKELKAEIDILKSSK